MTKLLMASDEHYPHQDEGARSVALKIAQDFGPDVRIAGSDGLDFYAISKFDKDPSRLKAGGLQHEIDMWQSGQREWNSATPAAHPFFLVGNHEDRLRKYLWRHPELYDLEVLQLPALLGLASLGIYWEKDKGYAANQELMVHGNLLVKHGDVIRKFSAYTAKAALEQEHYSVSVLMGHTHRGGTSYARTRNGVVIGQECFCLCSLEPEYLRHPDWQQGIVLAEITPTSLTIEPIPFYREFGTVKAIWRGKEYKETI